MHICPHLITAGKRRGYQCGRPAKYNGYCKPHHTNMVKYNLFNKGQNSQ